MRRDGATAPRGPTRAGSTGRVGEIMRETFLNRATKRARWFALAIVLSAGCDHVATEGSWDESVDDEDLVGYGKADGNGPFDNGKFFEADSPATRGPILSRSTRGVDFESRYIVALRAGEDLHAMAADFGGEPLPLIHGFVLDTTRSAARAISDFGEVSFVEETGFVALAPDPVTPLAASSWGLDRLDQRSLPLDDQFHSDFDGTGVTAYIVDTGIDLDHPEFADRILPGFSAIQGGPDDCNGHGSHVAGTVAGATYGVAPRANLVPVRVLSCAGSGTNEGVIRGVQWVAEQAAMNPGPAVANMSLGGGPSRALNDAVSAAIAAGVTFVVAAGNEDANACSGSPSSTPEAITVGATDRTDARASFSNFGQCVDVFAPGVAITSAWFGGGTKTISGTSMASPHVAGLAALVLQSAPDASPAIVTRALLAAASLDLVQDPQESPNRLATSLFEVPEVPTPTEPDEPQEPVVPGTARLMMNEIMINEPNTRPEREYAEIVNLGPDDANLEGWEIHSGRSGSSFALRHRFPSFVLPAGAAVVVYGGDWSTHPLDAFIASEGRLALSNKSGTIQLVAPSGELVDALVYTRAVCSKDGVSANRAVDADPDADWVLHDAISSESSSPGMRSDGSPFGS